MTLAINDQTAGPDDAPKVEVLATGLDPDVATVTAWRLSNGIEQEVGGIIRAAVAGAGTWIDYDVPAQAATYRLQYFDSTGVSLGYSESVTIELGYSGCWLHNPAAPTLAVRVDLAGSTGRSLSRPVPGSLVRPLGRRVGVVVANPRQGLTGLQFDVRCMTIQDADKVQAMLGTATTNLPPVICVRRGVDYSGFRVPSPLFLAVFDIAEEDINIAWGGGEDTRQRMVGDEAARPAPGIFIPLLRRKDVNAFYASRAAFNAAYLTRLAANRDYSLAGYAGV